MSINMSQFINKGRRSISILGAISRMKKITLHYNIERLVDFAFSSRSGGITPMQVQSEILGLLRMLERKPPKCILEIGTASGGTLFLFSRIASPDALIISVDLPGGRFGGGYPWLKSVFYKSFALNNQRIRLIRADSHEEKTLKTVKSMLGDKQVDFLFLDGDHAYEGVKKDYELYGPLIDEGGIIAFHDIVPHDASSGCKVDAFWNEIKAGRSYTEIVADWNQNWAGIGMLSRKQS